MNNAKVSIITPTYNSSKWLPYTIESVLAQTYNNYEMLIVDDGSIDNTETVVKPFLSYRKINYLRQNNLGQAAARNSGLKIATGKYVAYLDSDDTWEPTKLEKQIQMLEENDIQVCYTDVNIIDDKGESHIYSPNGALSFRRGMVLEYLFLDNFVPFSSVVIEKCCLDKVGGSDTSIRKSDDWDLLIRLSVFCNFDYIDEKLINYRVSRTNQISNDIVGRFDSINNIADNFIKRNPHILPKKTIKQSRAYRYRVYAHDIYPISIWKSLYYYILSLKYEPLNFRPFYGIARSIIYRLKRN